MLLSGNEAGLEERELVILKAAGLYFVCVFGVGCVLGAIRTLWVVPRLGTRIADLSEMPIMVAVVILAARSIVRHFAVPSTLSARLGVGCIGLGLMLIAEFAFLLRLRGLSIQEYWASRDPVAATAYYLALALFASLPIFVAKS